MRLDLAFVDLDHRPQCLRLASCFGWLHHPSVLRGLTPPACTNLHSSNSIQMCERNPTLSRDFSRSAFSSAPACGSDVRSFGPAFVSGPTPFSEFILRTPSTLKSTV